VGFRLDKLPIASEAEKFAKIHGFNPMELALYGGEEYELLVTVKPKLWQTAQKVVETVGGNLTKLGQVTDNKQILVEKDEKTVAIEARGWQHFKSASE
jgi:thiamine-monophosphate kinase